MAVTFVSTAELYIDGAWLDITRLDSTGTPTSSSTARAKIVGPISVTRGASDEQSLVTPTEVRFQYRDDDALLDGDNYASPLYGKVGPGTPLRVSTDGLVRAVVELVDLTPSWDDTVGKVLVDVLGAGPLRRLDGDERPLRSPAYRAFTAAANDNERVAYYPLEEESGATSVFSPYPTGAVTTQGTIEYGAVDSTASARLVRFGSVDASMFFVMPSWTNSLSQHFVGSVLRFPEASLLNNSVLYRMYFAGGNIDYMDLLWQTGNVMSLLAYQGSTLVDTLSLADWSAYIVDREAFVFVTTEQSGADVNVRVRVTNSTNWIASADDTMSTRTLGTLYKVVVGTGAGVEGLGFGHLIIGGNRDAFGNFVDDLDTSSVVVTGARGYVGERAGKRLTRLLGEEGISIAITGDQSDTERLDAQTGDRLIEACRSAERSDLGILYEHRATAGWLAYRTRVSLYNQAPTAIFTYAHLSKPFRPAAASDLRLVNDVTVQREGGGTAHFAIADDDPFHWSTQDPPGGAGDRPDEPTLNLYTDSQAAGQASLRAHLGSWREKRFKTVTYELHRDAFSADDIAAARELGLGDVIWQGMVGAPAWVANDEVRLMVRGYTETFDQHRHTIVFNTAQADAWEADVTDATGSTLVAAIDDNDTSLKIAPPSAGPEWDTSFEPYNIAVAGQPMTVTAMATDTPAFIAAGTASHAVNASTTPGLPAGMTPDVGQIMILFAAIRNSGTGTVNVPTGWSDFNPAINFGNVRVMYRYRVTGDSSPTVTYSGGAASEDTSSQIVGFSGLSHQHAGSTVGTWLSATPGFNSVLNGSAQNITTPQLYANRAGGVVLFLGWKQDDWTSVATHPLADAEIGEPATTTGNDQGIVWDYDIYTTKKTVAASAFVVTGGASAISRGLVVALRPLQTATVTRGIAGTAASAAAASAVHVWRPGINGL